MRKLEGGVMCPSFRVTKDEKDSQEEEQTRLD